MRTRLYGAAVIAVCVIPGLVWAAGQGKETKAFHQQQKVKKKAVVDQQKQEKKTLKESLKGKPKEEKKAVATEHRVVQQAEKKTFMQKMRQDNIDFLKERLTTNGILTATQKNELVGHFDKQYQDEVSYRGAQQKGNVEFFEKTANDPAMTQEQKKAAITEHFAQQKTKSKEVHAKSAAAVEAKPQSGLTTEIPANIQPQPASSTESAAPATTQPAPAAKPSAGSETDTHAVEPSTVRQSF